MHCWTPEVSIQVSVSKVRGFEVDPLGSPLRQHGQPCKETDPLWVDPLTRHHCIDDALEGCGGILAGEPDAPFKGTVNRTIKPLTVNWL